MTGSLSRVRFCFPAARSCAAIAALLLAGGGCVGYQLGSMLPESLRTVYVPTIVNQTDEPLLEAEVTRALTSEIQFDGSLRMADAASADAVLEVRLLSYRLNPVAFQKEKNAAPTDYRAVLSASFVLRNQKTGAVLSESARIQGDSEFETGSDLTRAKTDAAPDVAKDLAKSIVSQMVEAW